MIELGAFPITEDLSSGAFIFKTFIRSGEKGSDSFN